MRLGNVNAKRFATPPPASAPTVDAADVGLRAVLVRQMEQRRQLERQAHRSVPPHEVPKERGLLPDQQLLRAPEPALACRQRRLFQDARARASGTAAARLDVDRLQRAAVHVRRHPYFELGGKGGRLEQRDFAQAFLGHVRIRPRLAALRSVVHWQLAVVRVGLAVRAGV